MCANMNLVGGNTRAYESQFGMNKDPPSHMCSFASRIKLEDNTSAGFLIT